MEMGKNQQRTTSEAASDLMLKAAIEALMRSHPDAAALRSAWDEAVSKWYGLVGARIGESPETVSPWLDELRREQARWESYIPRG